MVRERDVMKWELEECDIVGFEPEGKEPPAKECVWLIEARKGKKTDFLLESPVS